MSPRNLSRDEAAAYCRLKVSQFNKYVRVCGIPWAGSPKRREYDPAVLDYWKQRHFIPHPPESRARRRKASRGQPDLREVLGRIDPSGRLQKLHDQVMR